MQTKLIKEICSKKTHDYEKSIGRLVLSLSNEVTPQPFVKHIFWRSKNKKDTFSLEAYYQYMWISSYVGEAVGSYNITANGIVKLKADSPSRVRIRPVLYQLESEEQGLSQRSMTTDFDVCCDLIKGDNLIPFSSVLKFKSKTNQQKFGFVIMASGQSKITELSYTVSGLPSNAFKSVEVLTPQGLVSDYTHESEMPLYLIKYPQFKEFDTEECYE